MWHEARKQEKKIREYMVDYQRRAERRREHYEKLRGDPHQLLRIYSNKCKLHIDPKTSGELDSTMIPWQGDNTNMISRYDVRIHLDYIPDNSKLPEHEPSGDERVELERCNYERYRSLVQNAFGGVSEKEALASIEVEEMYPTTKTKNRDKHKSQARAAIAYRYEEEEEFSEEEQTRRDEELLAAYLGEDAEKDKAFSSESEYEMDMDVDEYGPIQVDKLNVIALEYGVPVGAFCKTLRVEKTQLEEQKLARIADLEKQSLTGKKARRERRMLKERRLRTHMPTPPSYARRSSPTYEPYVPEEGQRSESSSRSTSPEVGRVEYITEFGGGEGGEKQPENSQKKSTNSPREYSRERERRNQSRSRSPAHRHSYRRRSRSRSRERSYRSRRHSERGRSSRSRSRSRSRERERRHRRRYSRSRSRSKSRERRHSRRSRSPRPPRSRSRKSHSQSPRSHSRSRSREQYRSKRSHSQSPRPHSMRSHSQSPKPQRSRSRSRSRSHSPVEKLPSVATEKNKSVTPASAPKTKQKEKPKLTPQERLRRKMQLQLNKQYKLDKKTQREKEEQREVERMEREDDLRGHMRKLRDKERVEWEHREGWERRRSPSPSPSHYDYYGY